MNRAICLAALFLVLSPLPAVADCTAIADAATGKVLRQDGICDQRVTPASTFKIAISLMGYDAGFLKEEHNPELPFKKGYPAWMPSWRTTTDPAAWIKNSVVWYSQQVTQHLGMERFQHDVAAFGYGNQDVSGDPGKHNGLTNAWLSSSLRISPLEQLGFLERLVQRQLPVSANAVEMTSRITAIAVLPNGWDVHGKTGTGFPINPDGTSDREHGYGWFVGWASKGGRTLVFARLIQDEKREATYGGPRARASLMKNLPGMLDGL